MARRRTRPVSVGLVVFALLGSALPAPASAADCGGAMPCSCGDSVIASRTLVRGVDPVTSGACPGDGLIITGSSVALDLGGGTIQGSLATDSVGVRVTGPEGVRIRNGTIARFATGITGHGESVAVERMKVVSNGGAGIAAGGPDWFVRTSVARDNGGDGIRVGCGTIVDSRADRNGGSGMVSVFQTPVGMCSPSVRHVVSTRNAGAGFELRGDGTVTIERGLALRNGRSGYDLGANPGIATGCQAVENREHGFAIGGFGSVLSHVRTKGNGGFGIRDASLVSFYGPGNYCRGDALGDSDPPGLCQ